MINTAGFETAMIGNLCATSPLGMAVVYDEEAGFVLEPQYSGKPDDDAHVAPGTTAPDGSYFETTFEHEGAAITLTWGLVTEGAIAAKFVTTKAVDLPLKLRRSWASFPALWWSVDSGVDGYLVKGRQGYLPVSVHTEPAPLEVRGEQQWESTLVVRLEPDRPLRLAAGHGELPPFDTIDTALATAGKNYRDRRFASQGDWGEFAQAIADSMNYARTFSTFDRHRAHVVGRGWWIYKHCQHNPDYGPYFGWDQFFNGHLAAFDDPAGAQETVRASLAFQMPEGHITNCSHWDLPEGEGRAFVTAGRSQPPVGAMCVWKMHERRPDMAFLAEVYPRLARWNGWWHENRDGNNNGLLEWGDERGRFADALNETGWDDTFHYDGAEMSGRHMTADAVDLNALWSLDACYLAKIARALGETEAAEKHLADHQAMNRRINDHLWNEELGVYCSRHWNDREDGKPAFLTRLTPMNFYPLACGAADQSRAQRVLAWIFNKDKFGGEWILPTLAYDDPDWGRQHYWRGHIWPPPRTSLSGRGFSSMQMQNSGPSTPGAT